MGASTALGRAAMAVANCGDTEEKGCDLRGCFVAAWGPRANVLKNMCKFWSIISGAGRV